MTFVKGRIGRIIDKREIPNQSRIGTAGIAHPDPYCTMSFDHWVACDAQCLCDRSMGIASACAIAAKAQTVIVAQQYAVFNPAGAQRCKSMRATIEQCMWLTLCVPV